MKRIHSLDICFEELISIINTIMYYHDNIDHLQCVHSSKVKYLIFKTIYANKKRERATNIIFNSILYVSIMLFKFFHQRNCQILKMLKTYHGTYLFCFKTITKKILKFCITVMIWGQNFFIIVYIIVWHNGDFGAYVGGYQMERKPFTPEKMSDILRLILRKLYILTP